MRKTITNVYIQWRKSKLIIFRRAGEYQELST